MKQINRQDAKSAKRVHQSKEFDGKSFLILSGLTWRSWRLGVYLLGIAICH